MNFQGDPHTHPGFRQTAFYKIVRHPILLGFIVAFWATPTMTLGHLIFAIATTAYIVIGVHLEERDLVDCIGEDYRKYQRDTRMLIPLPKSKSSDGASESSGSHQTSQVT